MSINFETEVKNGTQVIHVYSNSRKSATASLSFKSLIDIYDRDQLLETVYINDVKQMDNKYLINGGSERFHVQSEWILIEDVCSYFDVTFTIKYTGKEQIKLGFQFTGELYGAGKPTWMIPGAFYKENRSERNTRIYPRYDYNGGNHEEMVSDYWSFRSDRAALPAIFAWNEEMSAALCTGEMSSVGLTSVGFQGNSKATKIWVNFPYREEPVTFVGQGKPKPKDVQLYTIKPGEVVRLNLKIYTGSSNLHAYDPFIRQMYKLHKSQFNLNPWMGLEEAAELTAHGLYTWHYNKKYRILKETASFDREGYHNPDREHMHVGWVSGAPYAYSLLTYGRKYGIKEYTNAAIDVLDHIASAIAPSGTFWASWVVGKGWGTGWNPKKEWLQARTIAEATLFFIRALKFEKSRGIEHPDWERAVLSNLEFAVRIQREDGNFGSYFHCEMGIVEEWDGAGGILWIAALAEGYFYFDRDDFKEAAIKGGHYYERYVLDEYFYGAPEDVHLTPTSEDGYNAVVSYVLLYELDKNEKWLNLAKSSADWMLTFRWTYNIEFPKHSMLAQYNFKSRGADLASPSNQHLHNYGLFCVPEMLRLWEYTGDQYYLERTRDNISCFLQFIARYDGDFNAYKGMVTERYYNTNCFQAKGKLLTLSHSWCVGLVLYAAQEAMDYKEYLDLKG